MVTSPDRNINFGKPIIDRTLLIFHDFITAPTTKSLCLPKFAEMDVLTEEDALLEYVLRS